MNASETDKPMLGQRVYSAGVIAAYTALANVPMGCVLYGLNLNARGAKRYGAFSVGFGILSGIALLVAALFDLPMRGTTLVGLVAALSVYNLEKRPVQEALRQGATRARWWPPALILLGIVAALCVIAFVMDAALPSSPGDAEACAPEK